MTLNELDKVTGFIDYRSLAYWYAEITTKRDDEDAFAVDQVYEARFAKLSDKELRAAMLELVGAWEVWYTTLGNDCLVVRLMVPAQ